jgi:hypothetical protein
MARVRTGALVGNGTVTNSGGGAATSVALDVGNGNGNGTFYGLLSDGAGQAHSRQERLGHAVDRR